MTEAWMKRAHERQKLLEKLMREAFEAEEECRDEARFYLLAAIQLTNHFLAERGGSVVLPPHNHDEQTLGRWPLKALEEIRRFGRTPEERRMLAAELLKKVTDQALAHAYRAMLAQEVHEPEKVYDGHGAMDEVPFEALEE